MPADYFSREAEEALLLAMLEGEPRDIMLLTGPPGSGKTATIARVLQRREERKDANKVTSFLAPAILFRKRATIARVLQTREERANAPKLTHAI